MKRSNAISSLLFVLVITAGIFADIPKERKMSFSLSGGITAKHLDYYEDWECPPEEPYPENVYLSEYGWLYGLRLDGKLRYGKYSIGFVPEFFLSENLYHYKYTSLDIPLSYSDQHQLFAGLTGYLGYDFNLGRFGFAPSLYFGFRVWINDKNESHVDGMVYSREEKYTWGYFGPGLSSQYSITERFTLKANMAYFYPFTGKVEYFFRNDLLVSVTLDFDVSDKLALFVGGEYERFETQKDYDGTIHDGTLQFNGLTAGIRYNP